MKKFSKEKQSSQLVNSANRDGRGFLKNRKKENQNKDDCQFHIKNNNYQHQEEQKK